MNKIANNLFNNREFARKIETLAKRYFNRRKGDYNTIALFESEDVEQELWCALFESDGYTEEELLDIAEKKAEALARQGSRKQGNPPIIEIPVSQLEENERHYVENLMYSSAGEWED